MSYKLPCEIVRDLLPSYVDGLTSPVTGESVQEHLDTCEPCRDCYDRGRPKAAGDVSGSFRCPGYA